MEEHFVDTIQHNHEAEFRFAERAIENFEIYNRKNITAVKDEKLRLDVFYATFQLMVTQSKLQLKKITIDEVDFQLMKDQFLMIFNCGFAELFLHYMERVTEDLVYTFMELNYMKSARVILSLYTHVLECIHKMEGEYTEQQSFQNKIAILHAEVQYFGLFFFESSQMMQSDSCWTEEKEQNEGIFVDLLKTLEIKDNYKDIPGVIQTFKQVIKIAK